MSKKILFVTTRNMVSMCGELNFISSRAKALAKHYDTDTVFFAFANQNKKNNASSIMKDFTVDYTFYSRKNIFGVILSYAKFCRKVLSQITKNDYDCVILSGIFCNNLAKKIRKASNIKIVYDCHGTNDEMIEFNPSVFRRILYHLANRRERQALKYSDGVFVVTPELKDHLIEKTGTTSEFYVVPCALNNESFSYEEALSHRAKWRKHFGIADNETLFIYSGGISPWQSIDDVYAAYKKYQKNVGNAKLLILTPKLNKISYKDVLKASFPYETVGEVLFAGDVACLLRHNCMTNRVAFPNKYLEYVRSNMLILTTPYLPCIARDVERENIGMLISSTNDFDPDSLNSLIKSRDYEKDYPLREKIIEKYSFKNTLKPFADMLGNNL